MKQLLLILSFTLGLTTAISANEKFFTPDLVGDVQIYLSDRAVNGCWTNLKETREYAEEQLRMRGYTVTEYKLLDHPEVKEAMAKYSPLVKALPNQFSEEDRYNLMMDVSQGDRFMLMIEVNAERANSGCFGAIRVTLERLSLGFQNQAILRAIAAELDTVGMNYQNFNISVLDNVKMFIRDIDSFRQVQFSNKNTAQ